MSSRVEDLLHRVIRRLRVVWAVDWLSFVAPILAVVALLLLFAARQWPITWPEPVALAIVVVAIVVIGVAAVVRRISLRRAALVADHALGTKDVFSTALEFDGSDGPFVDAIRTRADQAATAHRATEAVHWPRRTRRWIVAAVIGGLAISLLFITNPQDAARAARDRAQELIADQIAELEEIAEALEAERPEDSEAAERLEELIAELRGTDDLERADELLAEAQRELENEISDDLLAQRAANRGLERSLAADPISSAENGDAAEQLEALAEELDGLDAAAREELADRLEQLAEAQEVGNPEAAEALQRAAEALAEGDTEAAADALADAAAAQEASSDAIAAQAQLGEAANAAATARDGLARAAEGSGEPSGQGEGSGEGEGQGEGEGEGEGQGQGQGEGEGQGEGSGQGEGQGEGSGQGQGQGQGAGNPSGNVGGSQAQTGSGQGGQGNIAGVGNADVAPLDGATVLVGPEGTPGETINVDGTGDGPSETIGQGDTESSDGSITVPLSDVITDFRDQAIESLDGSPIPPSLRDQIAAYFEALAATTNGGP
ncbi:MAG: hypothetical protein R8F63_11505 [Acidimicrobiales bacterium]|nr:hypothetical protein [Acidimicrobiales bacterium]